MDCLCHAESEESESVAKSRNGTIVVAVVVAAVVGRSILFFIKRPKKMGKVKQSWGMAKER